MGRNLIILVTVATLATGCVNSRQTCNSGPPACGPCVAEGGDDNKCHYDCKAKTLFSWGICREDEKKDGADEKVAGGDSDDKKDGKEAAEKTTTGPGGHVGFARVGGTHRPSDNLALVADPPVTPPMTMPAAPSALPPGAPMGADLPSTGGSVNANGSLGTLLGAGEPNGGGKPEEPDTIVTDRPDFTEASSTVGRGRIQLEAGYTYFRDKSEGVTTHTHSYPELLFRVGVFADWFELRVGQNFGAVSAFGASGGEVDRVTGAYDLYLGTKIALTEQKGFLPEMAMILQTTVPTGKRALTGNGSRVLPGLSLLYSWDLTEKVSLAGSILGNKAVDDDGHGFTLFANSLSLGYSFTDKVGGYFEYFGFYPHGAITPGTKPEYYLNGGLTYQLTNNLQFDVRAGFGLSAASADFFSGAGFAVRY